MTETKPTVLVSSRARKILKAARLRLILKMPFYGHLAMNLRFEEGEPPHGAPACTDGSRMVYSASQLARMPVEHAACLLAHETLHCAFEHPWRGAGKDPGRWNVACDHVVNLILSKAVGNAGRSFAGLADLGGLCDPRYDGMSAERIYRLLPQEPEAEGDDRPEADGSRNARHSRASEGVRAPPHLFGEIETPSKTSDEVSPLRRVRWRKSLNDQLAKSREAGSHPLGLERETSDRRSSRVDWREALWRHLTPDRSGLDWKRRDRRRSADPDVFWPSRRFLRLDCVAVAVDTSGSMDERTLSFCMAEVNALLNGERPAETLLLSFDAEVHDFERYSESDLPLALPKLRGGGGTDFRPMFEALARERRPPDALVAFSDLYGPFPAEEPPIPTLWVSTTGETAPFGETAHLDMEDR